MSKPFIDNHKTKMKTKAELKQNKDSHFCIGLFTQFRGPITFMGYLLSMVDPHSKLYSSVRVVVDTRSAVELVFSIQCLVQIGPGAK